MEIKLFTLENYYLEGKRKNQWNNCFNGKISKVIGKKINTQDTIVAIYNVTTT